MEHKLSLKEWTKLSVATRVKAVRDIQYCADVLGRCKKKCWKKKRISKMEVFIFISQQNPVNE